MTEFLKTEIAQRTTEIRYWAGTIHDEVSKGPGRMPTLARTKEALDQILRHAHAMQRDLDRLKD
jgi:hypothetical protein